MQVEREIVSKYPYITNLMPKSVYVGEEYIFVPRIVKSGPERVILSIQEGPDWLYIEEETIVRGIPAMEDIGTHKVVLRVDDGISSSTVTEYIIVEGDEE